MAIILGGIFNYLRYTAFSTNVGFSSNFGIRDTQTHYFAAGFLIGI